MTRVPALLLLLALACTDKPVVERPRLPVDTTVSATRPDSADLGLTLSQLPTKPCRRS